MTSGRFYAETGKWGKGVKLSGKAKVELAQYVLKWTMGPPGSCCSGVRGIRITNRAELTFAALLPADVVGHRLRSGSHVSELPTRKGKLGLQLSSLSRILILYLSPSLAPSFPLSSPLVF